MDVYQCSVASVLDSFVWKSVEPYLDTAVCVCAFTCSHARAMHANKSRTCINDIQMVYMCTCIVHMYKHIYMR